MKKISIILLILFMSIFSFSTDTDIKKMIANDEKIDDQVSDFIENEYTNSFILSDRTLGVIATVNGNSYYVRRVEDANNFQLKLINIETGELISTLPYFKMDQFTLDPTGDYYIVTLGNGEEIYVPVWMDASSISQLLESYSGIPIYLNDELIGVTLFLTENIQLSLYSPFYGFYNVQFNNLTEKVFEDMKLDLYIDKTVTDFFKENKKKKKEKEKDKEKK